MDRRLTIEPSPDAASVNLMPRLASSAACVIASAGAQRRRSMIGMVAERMAVSSVTSGYDAAGDPMPLCVRHSSIPSQSGHRSLIVGPVRSSLRRFSWGSV